MGNWNVRFVVFVSRELLLLEFTRTVQMAGWILAERAKTWESHSWVLFILTSYGTWTNSLAFPMWLSLPFWKMQIMTVTYKAIVKIRNEILSVYCRPAHNRCLINGGWWLHPLLPHHSFTCLQEFTNIKKCIGEIITVQKIDENSYPSFCVVGPTLSLEVTIWKRNKGSGLLELRISDILFISKGTFSIKKAIGEM